MIRISGLTKTYRRGEVETPVLLGIDLTVDPGEMAAIMGPSGSGKSTMLHILGLLERADGGEYRLDGELLTQLGDDALADLRNRKIGFVFQAFHLLPRATALKNVLLPFTYADHYPADAEERARRALAAVGLEHRLHHRPGELSGGECQRVAVARALVTGPELILADEPTGNLDRRSSLEVMAILQKLNREGKTVVVITHDQAVGGMCRRRVSLIYGRIDSDQAVEQPVDAARLLADLPPPQENRP
ncbi:macrolide ABC transporter ATP-binding protein [Desulfocarbo indianensis]|nr:macrolide ABC transporter ATP-binding protein [Desulfocarbo indianensis]